MSSQVRSLQQLGENQQGYQWLGFFWKCNRPPPTPPPSYHTVPSYDTDYFLWTKFCRTCLPQNGFWVRGRMWFPRELSGKKAQKENTELWFPLTYLGCSCHTQGSQEKVAGTKPSIRRRQLWRTSSSSSSPSEWQLPTQVGHTHTQSEVLSFPAKWLLLPLFQSALGEGNHSNPTSRSPYRGPQEIRPPNKL